MIAKLAAPLILGVALMSTTAAAQPAVTNPIFELNTILMDLTFSISGPSAKEKDKLSIGTGFVVSKPDGIQFLRVNHRRSRLRRYRRRCGNHKRPSQAA